MLKINNLDRKTVYGSPENDDLLPLLGCREDSTLSAVVSQKKVVGLSKMRLVCN